MNEINEHDVNWILEIVPVRESNGRPWESFF